MLPHVLLALGMMHAVVVHDHCDVPGIQCAGLLLNNACLLVVLRVCKGHLAAPAIPIYVCQSVGRIALELLRQRRAPLEVHTQKPFEQTVSFIHPLNLLSR